MNYRKPEEVISEQYSQLAGRFKPEFGNQMHIEIAKSIGKIDEIEKKLKERRSAAAEIPSLEKTLDNLKGQALYLLKTYI